ncbi:MAG: hypothetical protein H7A49_07900 [Akkermansiaceae bacterium]|nr:hypothetical protein [Akkermansiaceae bacterium]
MPEPTPPSRTEIPESLHQQLRVFRAHLWRVKAVEAVAAGCIGLLVSFLLVYGLERVWQTPGWLRLVVLLAGVSLFAGFAPYWIHRWLWKQRREDQLARLIARRFPGLGDRLLGVIELQNQAGSEDTLSPRLKEAAMVAVAAETGRRDLADALPPRKHRSWSLAAMVLALGAGAALTLTPRAGLNTLERWLMPLADTERYTFTRLDNPPKHVSVAFGEAFDLTLRLAKDSEQHPAHAVGRYGHQPEVGTKLAGNGYTFTFPGQQDPGVIVFRIGDLRHEVRVDPVPRPSVTDVAAVVSPPEYLGIEEHRVDLKTGVLSVVEGSKVRVEITMNRPLAEAEYGPTRPAATGIPVANADVLTPQSGAMDLSGNLAATPALGVGRQPFEIPITWRDRLGLLGEPDFRVRVDAMPDSPPTCYLQGIDRQLVMLPEESIEFEVLAEDDFGVKTTGIEWVGQFTRPTDETPAKGELPLADGGPEQARMLANAIFSPLAFDIAPQKVLLRAYTEDYFPGRGRVYSEPVVVYVLTRDEHAALLKSRFDRQITELEDLARRELGLLEENQRLERLDGEQLQNDENRERLDNQQREESETGRRMEDLTRKMEDLLQDAARNGEIDKNTLKKMAESLQSMHEMSEQDVPKVEQDLAEANDPSNTPENSEKQLDEAVEKQQELVEKMREAIEKANEANRRMEAGTFVNRLKKAAGEQKGIVASLMDSFNSPDPEDSILGENMSDLDPSDITHLNGNIRQQSDTASDVRWIQEDLAHFFARTQKEDFQEIYEEMRDSGIDIGLDTIRTWLAENSSFKAAEESKKWGDQLAEWAGKLEKANEEQNGGGGGGGAPNSEDQDFEFMLRVMKMVQKELDLRSRTRAAEMFRRGAQDPNIPSEP